MLSCVSAVRTPNELLRASENRVNACCSELCTPYLLETLALESYRLGTLTQLQVGHTLGLSRIEAEDFLAQHADLYTITTRANSV